MTSMLAAKKKLLMAQKKGLRVQDVFNTSLWTGTGAARTIMTGVDSGEGALVWVKQRNATRSHFLVDTIRGDNNYLQTDTTAPQATFPTISNFTSSGYGLSNDVSVNGAAQSYVGWQFRRAEKFFDIVQFTGDGVTNRQIGHSLGGSPGMIFVRNTNTVRDLIVYQNSVVPGNVMTLNSTNAASSAAYFPAVTSSSFSVNGGIGSGVNATGQNYIAYLFAHDPSPEGLIQCGSFVGNGSATGPVVNLGWRPQYLLIKRATGGIGAWYLIDAARNVGRFLAANSSTAEVVIPVVSFLPSGFQIIETDASVNASGSEYIYMAIREAA